MMNKRGDEAVPGTLGFVFSLFIFILLVIIFMVINGIAAMRIDATVEAENAALTCKNNMMRVLDYQVNNKTNRDTLIEGYAKNDLKDFESRMTRLFDKYPGEKKWKISVYDVTDLSEEFSKWAETAEETEGETVEGEAEPGEITEFGKMTTEKFEVCDARVPIPCKNTPCILSVELKLSYEK